MTNISKGRWAASFAAGRKAEAKFKELMESRGNTCIKSSRSDDIHKHIDFYVNDVPVDVKGNRHLETIWLEIKNVRGNDGWLLGNSKFIVFDIVELSSFCFFDRLDLYNYTVQFTETTTDKKDYNKLYTREGREDVIVKVRYEDIEHLVSQCIRYE
jgi:hypothetical protein